MNGRRTEALTLGTLPFLVLIAGWAVLPYAVRYPTYMLPPIPAVLEFA